MRHPPPARTRVIHQAHLGEIDLALHPRLTISHPHRGGPTTAEPTPLGTKPVQRPIRHQHTPSREQISDLDHRQVFADPLADLHSLDLQRLPGWATPTGTDRAHSRHHLTDHLVRQLSETTLATHPSRLSSSHIPAGRFAVHPRLPGHRAQPPTAQPPPQHLTHLNHRNLPKRHLPQPPRRMTWTDRIPEAINPHGTTRRVVPSLATGWSHPRGRKPLRTVP
jgi:hypothetical protein